jgi:WD40 repeat protein
MGRRLAEAAREWEWSEQDPSFLLAGSRLDQSQSWESTTSLALGLEERAYLSASVARRELDRAEEAARQERERTLERRSVKRLRSLVAALTAAVVVAATLTAIAVNRNAEAQRATRLARARELASAATANLETDRELALLIVLEAVRTYGDGPIPPPVEEILRRAAPAVSIDTASILGAGIRSFEVTSDGRAMVLVGADGSVGVWDLVTGARRFALRSPGMGCTPHLDCRDVSTVQLSDDGSLLAAGDGDGVAHVWDLESIHELLTIPAFARLPAGRLGVVRAPDVTISPDERRLAIGRADGAIQLWDIASDRRMWTIRTRRKVESVRLRCCYAPWLLFGSDGTRLFFDNAPVNVAEVATGRTFSWSEDRFWPAVLAELRRVPSEPEHPAFAVNPDGYEVARLEGNHVRLVHLEALTERSSGAIPILRGDLEALTERSRGPIRILTGHTERIAAAAFSQDGKRLATGSFDGTARVWNVTSGEVVFTSPVESSDVEGVAFSEDGSRVAVIYSDGRIIVHAIALDDVIEIARARVTRGFTNEECRTFLHVSTCPAD